MPIRNMMVYQSKSGIVGAMKMLLARNCGGVLKHSVVVWSGVITISSN